MPFEGLYDLSELTQVRFIGFHSENARYDFGIVYTNSFFGKPLVIDMQSGRSFLLSACDINNKEWIRKTFSIHSEEDAEKLSDFFEDHLPQLAMDNQY